MSVELSRLGEIVIVNTNRSRFAALAALVALTATTAVAQARPDLPLKVPQKPTTSAITAEDLMTRVYAFADDSMQGREAGTPGHFRGTEYIARELKRLGLKPMGDSGTFFQNVPVIVLRFDAPNTKLTVDGAALAFGKDYHPLPGIQGLPLAKKANAPSAPIVYGGRLGAPNAIKPADAKGKLVVMMPPLGAQGQPMWQAWAAAEALASYTDAAGLLLVAFEIAPAGLWGFLGAQMELPMKDAPPPMPGPALVYITRAAASRLLDGNLETAVVGAGNKSGALQFEYGTFQPEAPVRNVLAMVEGSDPSLRAQIIVLSAHSDHDGIEDHAADHDSVRLLSRITRPMGAESNERDLTPEELTKFRAQLDSVRKLRPARKDSVMNGADDDASGSMGLLEIAELYATAATKPKRSIMFAWVAAEEKNLLGSQHFTDNPTVPRDSLIANVNIDMIGRGAASDIANGGNDYLQLLGSRRLSTEYGAWVEEVNKRPEFSLKLDYQFDANGHPQQYYCRSDHWNFARWGIPTVFFSTGSHLDYHMLTDEPQYLDYPHYAKVVQFVAAFAGDVAGRAARPLLDKPKPDPRGECQQ